MHWRWHSNARPRLPNCKVPRRPRQAHTLRAAQRHAPPELGPASGAQLPIQAAAPPPVKRTAAPASHHPLPKIPARHSKEPTGSSVGRGQRYGMHRFGERAVTSSSVGMRQWGVPALLPHARRVRQQRLQQGLNPNAAARGPTAPPQLLGPLPPARGQGASVRQTIVLHSH